MEAVANVVNKTPNASIKIPSTKYLIKKRLMSRYPTDIHIKCNSCSNFVPSLKNETKCGICEVLVKTSTSEYFVYIPIKKQLIDDVNSNIEIILEYYSAVVKEKNIVDLQNGSIYKNAQKNWPNCILLPLTLNADGVKVYTSSSYSLWMLQLYQSYLPPNKRFLLKNILIVAAHIDKHKPKMNDFLYPLLNELRSIQESGGISIEFKGQKYNLMPLIISCCCDLPAKADIQCMVGHSGKFGCGYCKHPAIPVKSDRSRRLVNRFIKGHYELRNHKNTLDTYERQSFQTPIEGIKGVSCMIAAKDFDLINSFAIDHMHCAELGIMKKLLSLWLDKDSSTKPYYIIKKKQLILSNKIVKIKPPSEISRKPKSIFQKGEYKANELRSMLLFYLPLSLRGALATKYVKHFEFFSSSMHMLLQESISLDTLNEAERKLNEFADSYEELYGSSNVTMNLHLLRHLALAVKNLGPLWSQSAYAFESNNGIIVKANNCTKEMVHQLAWKYTIKKTLKFNEKIVEKNKFSFGSKTTARLNSIECQLFVQSGIKIKNQNILQVYKDVTLRGTKYTSRLSKEIATIDYFVSLKNGTVAAICFYFTENFVLYALIDLYEIINSFDHFKHIAIRNEKQIIMIQEIDIKLIYLKFDQNEFVTTFPNRYEST